MRRWFRRTRVNSDTGARTPGQQPARTAAVSRREHRRRSTPKPGARPYRPDAADGGLVDRYSDPFDS